MSATALAPVTQVVVCNSTTLIGVPIGIWICAASVKEAQALIEVFGGGADFRAAPAYQTADTDPTNPNGWTALEGSPTFVSPGSKDVTAVVDISSATGTALWIRFGALIKLNSGSTLANGDITLTVTVRC